MPRLKDRNRQTPGGHQFYDPVLKYRPRPWASVDEIAQGLLNARLGNPALTQQNAWSTDIVQVTNEVDAAIARHCQHQGWNDFIVADTGPGGFAGSTPFSQRPQNLRFLQRLKNVAANPILEFITSKEEAVPQIVSNQRATICAGCEFNEKKKSLLDIFTTSVSESIRRTLEIARNWSLKTDHDSGLGVCEICQCPLRLKVHMPIKRIRDKMPNEVREKLPEWCWIKIEP